MIDIKQNISTNLTKLRKGRKLTQSELAERFDYSDKAVSKWEHGDAIPSVETLQQLADFYGVTLDYLTHEITPENKRVYSFTKTNHFNKNVIIGLSVSLVWILAIVAAIGAQIINGSFFWMAFLWAIPASLLIGIVFNGIWGPRGLMKYIIIGFTWTLLGCIYLELCFNLQNGWTLWMLFLLGIPATIGTVLWSHLKGS
jgi:Predicted transcriptional regulators